MRYKGSGVSWKRFVSTQVLFNLIEFPFVYQLRFLRRWRNEDVRSVTSSILPQKSRKKKKKEKKMTTRRTKFDYFLQGNFKQWKRHNFHSIVFLQLRSTSARSNRTSGQTIYVLTTMFLARDTVI